MEKIHDLGDIAFEIKVIIQRINDDLIKFNDAPDFMDVENENLSEDEKDKIIDEMLDSSIYINHLIIDIKSLFIWLMMFLDKIPDLIVILFNKNPGIKIATYSDFIKSIKKNDNEKVIELWDLFYAYDITFQKIRTIRHKYTIHKSKSTLAGVTSNANKSYFGIQLHTYEKKLDPSITLNNDNIDSFIIILKAFLKDLNKYLCDNVIEMPFNS